MRDALEHGMSAARLTTTPSDVAAFAALHVADRAEKRRNAIEDALAMAAERKRFEERLGSQGRGILSLAPDSNSSLPPSSASSLHYPRDSMTVADSPEALVPPIELVAKLTARAGRHSDAPQPSSYATLGLAAVDSSSHTQPAPRSRKGPVAVFGLLLVAVAVAAAARLDVLRPEQAATSRPAIQPVQPPVPLGTAKPPPIVTSPPATVATTAPTATAPSYSLLPTVNASALPKATTTAATPGAPDPGVRPRPQRWVPPKRTQAAPAEPTEPEPAPEPAAPGPAPTPPPAPPPAPAPTRSKSAPKDDGF